MRPPVEFLFREEEQPVLPLSLGIMIVSAVRLVAFTLQGGQIIVPGVGAYDLDQVPFALALCGSFTDSPQRRRT